MNISSLLKKLAGDIRDEICACKTNVEIHGVDSPTSPSQEQSRETADISVSAENSTFCNMNTTQNTQNHCAWCTCLVPQQIDRNTVAEKKGFVRNWFECLAQMTSYLMDRPFSPL